MSHDNLHLLELDNLEARPVLCARLPRPFGGQFWPTSANLDPYRPNGPTAGQTRPNSRRAGRSRGQIWPIVRRPWRNRSEFGRDIPTFPKSGQISPKHGPNLVEPTRFKATSPPATKQKNISNVSAAWPHTHPKSCRRRNRTLLVGPSSAPVWRERERERERVHAPCSHPEPACSSPWRAGSRWLLPRWHSPPT